MNDLISRQAVMQHLSKKNKNGVPDDVCGRAVYYFVENLIDEIRDNIPCVCDMDISIPIQKELEKKTKTYM